MSTVPSAIQQALDIYLLYRMLFFYGEFPEFCSDLPFLRLIFNLYWNRIINSVKLASGVQQSDSIICNICVSSFPTSFPLWVTTEY